MSSIIAWPISFLKIFSIVINPLILLRYFNLVGGKTFGTGVTYSVLNMVGHMPCLIEEFRTFVTGIESSLENIFNMAVGMSPGGTDFFASKINKITPDQEVMPFEN